jgi:hypothetical protein
VRNTDIADRIFNEGTRETLMWVEEELHQVEKDLRYAENELRDAGRDITLRRPRSGKSLRDLRLLIDAGIEERKARK